MKFPPHKKQRGAAFRDRSDAGTIVPEKDTKKDGIHSTTHSTPSSVDQRNAGKVVDVLCAISLRREPHNEANHASVSKILRSLLFVFVAWQSRRPVWFTSSEWSEIILSSRHIVAVLDKYCDGEDREQNFVKYHIDTALFRGSGDKTGMKPSRPEWNVDPLFTGLMKTRVRHAIARRDMAFLYSLQKGTKKAWPKMSSRSLAKAYDTHSKLFSTDHGALPLDLKEEVEVLSRETFSKLEFTDFTKFIPRGSASVEMGRGNGGCLELFEPFVLPSGSDVEAQGRLRALHSSLESWRVHNLSESKRRVDEDLFNEVFPESLELSAIGIFEPGKIRMITKGSGHLYSLLQPLQGAMLNSWKLRKESTMLHPDLSERVRDIQIRTQATELTHWASIDYKSATDLIKQDGTFAALSGLVGKPFYEYALASFGVGKIHYPRVEEENPDMPDFGQEIRAAQSVWRIDGQPMGHPLSFPLLCLINLAVYRVSIDRWIKSGSLGSELYRSRLGCIMRRNVLVNGDDMLFKCHPSFYDIFNATAAEAGLHISPGKQYLSTTFAMINSQIFTFEERKRTIPIDFQYVGGWKLDDPISLRKGIQNLGSRNGDIATLGTNVPDFGPSKRVGYLNMNIVDGNTLKKTSEVQATPVAIARDLNLMISLCPWTQCVLPTVLDKWKEDWFRSRFQPDWFVRPWLGGFGVDRKYAPADWRPSRQARRQAACFVHDPKLALYRMKGLGLKLGDFMRDTFSYKMVPLSSHHVPTELEVMADTEGDKWLGEIMYAGRLIAGSQPLESDAVFADRSLVKVFREWKFLRLRPFKDEDFERYDSVQFLANFRAPCPPRHTFSHLSKPSYGGLGPQDLTCFHHIQSRIDPQEWRTFREQGHWLTDRERSFMRGLSKESRESQKVLDYYKTLPAWGGLRDQLLGMIKPPNLVRNLAMDQERLCSSTKWEEDNCKLSYPIQWVKYDPLKPKKEEGKGYQSVGPIAAKKIEKIRNRPYVEVLKEIQEDCNPKKGNYPDFYCFTPKHLRKLEFKCLAMGLETYSKGIASHALQHRGTSENLKLPLQGAQKKFGKKAVVRPVWFPSFEPKKAPSGPDNSHI